MSYIMVIDDDRTVHQIVKATCISLGCECVSFEGSGIALEAIRTNAPNVVLLDLMLPGISGLDVFRQIQQIDNKLPVIFITAANRSDITIQAMQLGAFDYVNKPLHIGELKQLIERAAEVRRMMNVPVAIGMENKHSNDESFIGNSPEMVNVFKAVGRYAAQDIPVMIRGESGTGKELVARAIYQHGLRTEKPFLAVNCAALPDNLLESELFGHEKGSFTGADQRRIGKFEQCDGGTIFLDEVGEMSPLVQGKVLRLLQQQQFERVGGNQTITTDVRVIAATNRNIEDEIESGNFREDLFYRLNGVTITLPALRNRGSDLEMLVEYFMVKTARELGKTNLKGLAPDALKVLKSYEWPGNVRELQSVIRQAVVNTTGPVIVTEFLPSTLKQAKSRPTGAAGASVVEEQPVSTAEHYSVAKTSEMRFEVQDKLYPAEHGYGKHSVIDQSDGQDSDVMLGDPLSELIDHKLQIGSTDLYAECLELMERTLLTKVLEYTGGNQSNASQILGITRGKIRDRIQQFQISVDKRIRMK